MARNRRNKRTFKKITELISFKTFCILLSIFAVIILVCVGTIFYRHYQDEKLLAQQRQELDQRIESIFTETEQNIADSNSKTRDSIIRFSAVGDILCGEEMLQDAYQEDTKSYNFDPMFQGVSSFLQRSDIILGTMETNFTNNSYSGYGNRNSPKQFAQAVKNTGVNLVSLSTNHSLDYGIKGLTQTKEYLQSIGFSTVGDSLGENTVTIKTVKDTKFAFLSYTYGVENQASKTKKELASVNIYSEESAKKDLEYAKENADYIFVIMHWGEDYATNPSKEQKEIADFLIENGANVILGNHPAVIQPMEVRKNEEGENVFIAYSLGNYISSIDYANSKIELVLNIELRKSGEDGKVYLSKVDYTPIYVLDRGQDAENRYQLIDMKGIAKAYANGNKDIVSKETYEELLKGLDLLEEVVETNEE